MSQLKMKMTSEAGALAIEPPQPQALVDDGAGGQGYPGRGSLEPDTRLAEDLLDGLTRRLKQVRSTHLYDTHGAQEIRTEISARFTRQKFVGNLAAARLSLTEWMTARDRLVGLSLSHRPQPPLPEAGGTPL
jgi:uncharacterized SAM-dependent methyltransferase